jgi:hypothetical protein
MNNTNKMEATQIKNPDEQAIAMFSNYIRAKGKVVQKKGGRKSFLNNGSVMELNPASPQVPTKIKRERDAPVVSPALMSSKAQKLNGVTLTSRINQYENRLQAGKLMLTFNGDKVKRAMPAIKDEARLPGVKKESSRNRGVQVSKVVGFANKNYKFMYATLEDRASQLETSCLNLTSQIVSEYKLDEPSPISLPSQEPVVLCGKICCDAQHGKLNPTAVLLEGTMALSAGRSVKLEMSALSEFALFPGQTVAVRGVNNGGRSCVVNKMWHGVPPPAPRTSVSKLNEYNHSPKYLDGKQMSIMLAAGERRQLFPLRISFPPPQRCFEIAFYSLPPPVLSRPPSFPLSSLSPPIFLLLLPPPPLPFLPSLPPPPPQGPFCTSDNLSYAPLGDLLSRIKEDKPHVLIMTG